MLLPFSFDLLNTSSFVSANFYRKILNNFLNITIHRCHFRIFSYRIIFSMHKYGPSIMSASSGGSMSISCCRVENQSISSCFLLLQDLMHFTARCSILSENLHFLKPVRKVLNMKMAAKLQRSILMCREYDLYGFTCWHRVFTTHIHHPFNQWNIISTYSTILMISVGLPC